MNPAMPCTLSILLGPSKVRNGELEIEMTASYGGPFDERRKFSAAVNRFCFIKQTFDDTTVPLDIDEHPHTGTGNYEDVLDYLMFDQGSIWRKAVTISEPNEKQAVIAIADTCKAKDDFWCATADQDSQCRNLLQRLPSAARNFVERDGLIGKTGGSSSTAAHSPAGPKV